MENHTKRIRKARRQGLGSPREIGATRARFGPRGQIAGEDMPSTPRANARRRSTMTTRKAKRQGSAVTGRQRTDRPGAVRTGKGTRAATSR